MARVESPWCIELGLCVREQISIWTVLEWLCYISRCKCDIASVSASSITSLAIVDGVLELYNGVLAQHTSYRQALISHTQHRYAAGQDLSFLMLQWSEAGHDELKFHAGRNDTRIVKLMAAMKPSDRPTCEGLNRIYIVGSSMSCYIRTYTKYLATYDAVASGLMGRLL